MVAISPLSWRIASAVSRKFPKASVRPGHSSFDRLSTNGQALKRTCRDSMPLTAIVARPPSGQERVLERVVGEIGVGLQLHLLQYARPVGAYRLDAQVQLAGDFRGALAGGELVEDLELALRQRFVRLLV